MRSFIVALTLGAALAPLASPAPAQCSAASSAATAALLELYTSEGCDSCPPADRWLARLRAVPASGLLVVPVAFHVDYWDRLGWSDRFGQAAFSARQYDEAKRRAGDAFVYTPQVVLQGRDYEWRTANLARDIAAINAMPARASITLSAERVEGGRAHIDIAVEVRQAHDRAPAVATVALVQSGLVSDVKSGENQGKRLAHDYVARQWRTGLAIPSDGRLKQSLEWVLPVDSGAVDIVAFVEDRDSGETIQALALPLCADLATHASSEAAAARR